MSRFPLWFLLVAVGSAIVNAYYGFARMGTESVGPTIEFVASIIAMALFTLTVGNRLYRPVVEIGDGSILHGSVFRGFRWREKMSDVAEVMQDQRENVLLLMKSGRKRKISMFEVAKADRDAARQAIADAVASGSD